MWSKAPGWPLALPALCLTSLTSENEFPLLTVSTATGQGEGKVHLVLISGVNKVVNYYPA